MPEGKKGPGIVALVAIGFGALTVVAGGTTLLGALDMGAVVPFVLWFNTVAGLGYIGAGVGLWFRRRWAFHLGLAVLVATLVVFGGFGLHVVRGGAFEVRTVAALVLRCAVLAVITLAARRASAGR